MLAVVGLEVVRYDQRSVWPVSLPSELLSFRSGWLLLRMSLFAARRLKPL